MIIRLVLALDDRHLQKKLEKEFTGPDIQTEKYGHLKDAWQKVERSCGDVIIISESRLLQPVETGIANLNNLPENPVTIILHHSDSSEKMAQLTAAGADVVLSTGISHQSLVEAIDTTLESRRQFVQKESLARRGIISPRLGDFVMDSEVMRIFISEVQQIVQSDSPILITGETGVGKEHLAKAIHAESVRSNGPFVTVNTTAFPDQLLESELFGHEQGAFTGATRYRRGSFEQAHGGTLFLDEIGDMPLHLQAKLLRVLQDYEVKPLGSEKSIWVDIRVIAATNKDLEKEIEKGNFRLDLYYRLSVLSLTIPPLRERREDIPALSRRFINYNRYKLNKDPYRLSQDAIDVLCAYEWPGNTRELMNIIERAMLLSQHNEITLKDLPQIFHRGINITSDIPDIAPFLFVNGMKNKTLPEILEAVRDHVEKKYIEMVLTETAGRVGRAAGKAGINQRGFYNKMKKYGLRKEDFK